tara:strand:+ start:536 stop:1846 length:1311 start_codon:yes stop_codon:yes gene_type:complete
MDTGLILRHYKRKDIQDAMVQHFDDREVAVRYPEAFGRRPDVIRYPGEIIDLAVQGVTSFHCSEERWDNPMHLASEKVEDIRIGWDLVLDIDCAIFEYSQICADVVVQFLTHCGVKDISVKFSGNKGFHIGVPFEAFPSQVGGKDMRLQFPEAPRRIAAFITEKIKHELGKKILQFEHGQFSTVADKTGFHEEIIGKDVVNGQNVNYLNVEPFLVIDTILIAPRHLYRAPYSLHEKSGLISVPIDPYSVLTFTKDQAKEGCGVSNFKFLDRNVTGDSAANLLMQALDFKIPVHEDEKEIKKVFVPEEAVPEELFPECIKKLSEGMGDGKKRAVFCLMNFLGRMGWSKEQIREWLLKWNKKNKEPLRENYIESQLKFSDGSKLPPNCQNDAYYKDLGVYSACDAKVNHAKIKNPVNVVMKKLWFQKQDNAGKKKSAK